MAAEAARAIPAAWQGGVCSASIVAVAPATDRRMGRYLGRLQYGRGEGVAVGLLFSGRVGRVNQPVWRQGSRSLERDGSAHPPA